MKGIIDRFEGDMAVIEAEGRQMLDIPRVILPGNAKEGDVIVEENGNYRIDITETQKRRQAVEDQTKDLWK